MHATGVGGGIAVAVDGGVGGKLFAGIAGGFDTIHIDIGGDPVDEEWKSERRGGGEGPRVGVGAQGGTIAAQRSDFGERRGGVGVGDEASLGGGHDVTGPPKVGRGVVDGNLGYSVLVGELDGTVDGAVGDCGAELFVGVPGFGGREAGRSDFDLGTGDAAAGAGTEVVIVVEGAQGNVGPDPVAGGLGTEIGSGGHLISLKAALEKGGRDQGIVVFAGNG